MCSRGQLKSAKDQNRRGESPKARVARSPGKEIITEVNPTTKEELNERGEPTSPGTRLQEEG